MKYDEEMRCTGSKAAYIILAAVVLLFTALSIRYWSSEIDDVYIDLLHARNLVEYGKLAIDFGSHPVEGFSSPLNVLLHALFFSFGIDNPIFLSKFRGLLAGVFSVIFTYLITCHLSRNRYIALVAACILGFTPSFQYWAVSGLETPIYSFLLVLTVYFFVKRPIYSSIPLGLLSITRPEGSIYFFITLLFFFTYYSRKQSKEFFIKLLGWLGIFITVSAPYFLFRIFYFQSLFPNTFYAKINDYVSSYAGIVYSFDFFVYYAPYAFLIPFLVLPLGKKSKGLFLALAFICAQLIVVIRAGGDWMPKYRFMTMVMPLIVMVSAVAIQHLVLTVLFLKARERVVTNGLRRPSMISKVVVSLTLGICIISGMLFLGFHAMKMAYMKHYPVQLDHLLREHKDIYLDVASVITNEVNRRNKRPQDLTIALEPVGIIPFFTKTRVLDLSGKTDRDIGRSLQIFGPELSREKDLYVSEIFYKRLPEFFCRSGGMHSSHQEVIMADPRFEALYISLGTVGFVQIFARKIQPELKHLRFFGKPDGLFTVNGSGSLTKVEEADALRKSKQALSSGLKIEIFSRFDSMPFWFTLLKEAGAIILEEQNKYFWRFKLLDTPQTVSQIFPGLNLHNTSHLSEIFAPGAPEWYLMQDSISHIRLNCTNNEQFNLLSLQPFQIREGSYCLAEASLKIERKAKGDFGLYWSTYRKLPLNATTVIETGNTILSADTGEWQSLMTFIPLSDDAEYLSVGVGGYENAGGILLIKDIKVTLIHKILPEKTLRYRK